MWNNPVFCGVAAAATFYLYRIYQRSQEPEETRTEVSFLTPALVGCAVAGMVHIYNSQEGMSDIDSDFESGLVDMMDIERIAPVKPAPNMDVYTAIWE